MRAAVFTKYGGAVEVVDVPVPELLPDSVLIKVGAAAINPIDSIIRAGYMQSLLTLQLPVTLGFDVSGVVTECGSEVTQFQPGDEIFGRADTLQAGTIADFVVVKASDLAIKPQSSTHAEAASIPLAALTAWEGLVSEGEIARGQRVLIQAGSGGVGTFAIQIAKHFGAFVATTTSAKNEALVTSLGADVVIDYQTQDFEAELSDYDLVLDMLGGETLVKSLGVLRRGGTLVSIKGSPPPGLAEQFGVTFKRFFMWPDSTILAELAGLVDAGVVKPVIDRVYPIAETADAYEYLAGGAATGKVVIEVNP